MERQRLNVPAAVESGIDAPSIREVLPDGTFVAEPDSHFALASDAVASLVHRDLSRQAVPRPGQQPSVEPEDPDAGRKWSMKVASFLDSALYELGQIVAVVDAIRPPAGSQTEPILEVKPSAPAAEGGETESTESKVTAVQLMAKQRALRSAAAVLRKRAEALKAWTKEDDTFCESLLVLRGRNGELRRDSAGKACVDVGDAMWTELRRSPFGVTVPAFVSLDVQSTQLSQQQAEEPRPAPLCAAEMTVPKSTEQVSGLIRRSRISQFHARVYHALVAECGACDKTLDISTSSLVVKCGPNHTLRVSKRLPAKQATERPAPTTKTTVDELALGLVTLAGLKSQKTQSTKTPQPTKPVPPRTASTAVPGPEMPTPLLDLLTTSIARHKSAESFEQAIDRAVRRLRLLVRFTRDRTSERSRAIVSATAADGDGPTRQLASFVLGEKPGSVVVTPAFGVILPSMIENSAILNRLEDIPGSFVCATSGGEIESLLALLVSVRLLDALEGSARVAQKLLSVDRQGFSVVVNFPVTEATLRAKVWADGKFERSQVTVWMDGSRIEMPSPEEGGRLNRWKELMRNPPQKAQ